MEKLAKQLNSGEEIDVAQGDFFVELLFFKKPGRGSGCSGKKGNPGRMSFEKMLKKKKCVVQIKNKDQLCCAQAIVVMREYLKCTACQQNSFENIKKDRGKSSQQLNKAKKLHQEGGVSEGPCGREELKQFQTYLGSEYQLIVLEGMKGQILFKDRAYDRAGKVISQVKMEHHYHGLTSIPALLNCSYFCRHCEKAYSNETAKQLNCVGHNCHACQRGNKACPNFAKWVTPEVVCEHCHITFYGPECFEAHRQKQGG